MLLYPEKPYKELHSKALQINTKAKWKIFQTYKAASTFEVSYQQTKEEKPYII